MPVTLILHINDEDPVVGEADDAPAPADQLILITNPRRLDNKDLPYLQGGVVQAIWPIHRLNFIEIMPTDEDEIIGFVRE
jgi:hypothetical protein